MSMDPFAEGREGSGVLRVETEGAPVAMLLRMQDVRKAAKDWKTYSSDLAPDIVIHSEADVRSVRQLPIECDPPDHTDYRALVQPLFDRPNKDPEYKAEIETLVDQMVADLVHESECEIVRGFALPLQSKALARLLSVPDSEADVWIQWGVHVFYDRDEAETEKNPLEAYTGEMFRKAEENPGEDFFSHLNQLHFRGRPLTFEEKQGFANVTFAGGRDTVINTISGIFAYLAEHPETLQQLKQDRSLILPAVEEFVRYVSPLTAIARKCPHATALPDGSEVSEGNRIAMCWPSANRDASVFSNPDEVVLDRKPNPHISFGFGKHNCLGAPHARLILRSLLTSLCDRVDEIQVLKKVAKLEEESSFTRENGYEQLNVKLLGNS